MTAITLLSRLRQIKAVVRLKPFTTEDVEGRSKERLRRVALTAIASVGARGINLATTFISVPLTIKYLGIERYGLWLVISSVITLLGFADLGMGNGLLNTVAEADGKDDRTMVREYVSSALFMLLVIAGLFALFWLLIYSQVNWGWVFNLSSARAQAEAGPALMVFMGCFLVGMPLGITQKIQLGYQEGFINNLWQSAGSVLGLLAVLVAIMLQADLPWLVLAMAGSPVLITAINGIMLFGRRNPWLRPHWRAVRRVSAWRVLKTGLLFFVLQIAVAVGFQSDNIVIARYLGADLVPQYAVPMRLFMIVPSLVGYILTPLWPAYREAIARQDVSWVKKTFRRSVLMSVIFNLVPTIFLITFGNVVLNLWVGPEITTTLFLRIGLGLWAILYSMSNSIAMVLNGANVIGFQVVCAGLMSISNILLSIVLVQVIGVSGPVYGSLVAQMLFALIPFILYAPRLFTKWQPKSLTQTHRTEVSTW